MSALTKVFVILHVVVSLLLVAGMVVFVNKVEDFGKTARDATESLKLQKSLADAERAKSQQILGEKEAAANEATARANTLSADLTEQRKQNSDLQAQLAEAKSATSVVQTQLTTATTALATAQATNKTQTDVGNGLRTRIEDVEKKNTESEVKLSDLNERLDAANQELRFSKEQVAALQTELDRARRDASNAPVHPAPAAPGGPGAPGARPAAPAGAGPVAPTNLALRGVVNSKFQVGPVDYATVGLGTADGVAKGTRFNVVDPSGAQFLGYLTVDSVSPNEASGHLSGPNVSAIQKGSRVMTSWQ